MANGLSDILSVYRQGLASERQSRQSEMQFALQAMQFESAQRFREEGRQREDIMGVLDYTKKSAEQAKSLDAGEIYSRISSLEPIMSASVDTETMSITNSDGIIKKLSKPLNKRGKYGFSIDQATQIVTIANLHQMAGKNANLVSTAQKATETFAKQVARDYEQYPNSGLMKAMEKSGLIYKGLDPLQKELSADTYLGVRDALIALQNIDKEQTEIAAGDYKVDTPITIGDVSESDVGQMDWKQLAVPIARELTELSPTQVDLQTIDLGATDDDIIKSLDFLDPSKTAEVRSELESINKNISNKRAKLDILAVERDSLIADYEKWNEEFNWQKKQEKAAMRAGDAQSEQKHSKEAERLSKLIGARKGETTTSEASKEFLIQENIESFPAGYTRKAFEEPGAIGKAFGKFFDVPSKEWAEETKGVQILQLSNDIKKLVAQRESFSGR